MNLFGGGDMSLGISVILRDQFTGTSSKIRSEMKNLDADARRMHDNQMRMQRDFNAAGAMIGVGAISQMKKWVDTGAEFGYIMEYVNQIAKKNTITYEQLTDKAKELGEQTIFSATDIADAMRLMAMAGQDTQQIFNNITAATNLAASTMTQLGGKGGAADILTNVMKGFNIESTLENSTRVADVLTTATSAANINLIDLGEALKYTTSTAKDLNVSLEETAAMIMMAGDAGIQGSMAGTAVENMLRYITQAAGEAASGKRGEILAQLGLNPKDLQDAHGNLLPIHQLMTLIGQSVEGLGNVDRQNALDALFGVRGKREASLLLRNMQDFAKYTNILNTESTGAAARISEGMMGSLFGQMEELKSTWDSFKIAFTEAIAPVLFPLLKVLQLILRTITNIIETPFGKFLAILATGFIVAKTATMGYRAIVATLSLVHSRMGTSMMSAASQVVGSYTRMTAAATTYMTTAMAANAIGMTPGSSMGSLRMNNRGQFYKMMPGGGSKFVSPEAAMRYNQMYGNKLGGPSNLPWYQRIGKRGMGMMPKFGGMGNMFKGGGIGWGLAGMGVNMLGDYVGGNTGKALGVAGTTMSYAGTGAMIGSVIPGIGTAIGGLIGGVVGLGSGIWDWVTASEDNTEALEDNTQTQGDMAMAMQDPESFWKNSLAVSRGGPALMDQYGLGSVTNLSPFHSNRSGMKFTGTNQEYFDPMYRPQNERNMEINFYMDGEKKFQEMIDRNETYNNIELGLY